MAVKARHILVALVVWLASVELAHGQAASEAGRFNRTLEQIQRETILQANTAIPIDQRMTLDYGGYVSFSYGSLDDNNNDNHGLRQTDLYGYGRLNIDGAHEFFLRYHASYRDFNEGDEFTPNSSGWYYTDLDRAYYRFDLARSEAAYHGKAMTNNLVLEGGRDFVFWANGLVMAQTIDGGMLHANYGALTLDAIAGVTPKKTVDFDPTRPKFDINTHRGFYGAMLGAEVGTHHPFIYAMWQQDYNDTSPLVIGPITTDFDYNSLYLGFGSNGNIGDHWLYGIEVAHESGQGLSNSYDSTTSPPTPVPQTQDDLDAWGADARIDYLVNDIGRTRITGEVIAATGENDRLNTTSTFAGNKPNTVDHAFNAFGALNTGLAFAPNVSNIISARLGASTFPLPGAGTLGRLQVGTDFFVFHKFDDDAPIDEDTTAGVGYLGWEPDIYANWQITSDVTFAARYGIFFPNEDATGSSEARQFLYLGVTYAF
jgi:hypothetical protein